MLDLLCSGFLAILNSSNKHHVEAAALIQGRRLLTFLSQLMQRLIRGGAYSSKYGIYIQQFVAPESIHTLPIAIEGHWKFLGGRGLKIQTYRIKV